jgi:hypothetical protein
MGTPRKNDLIFDTERPLPARRRSLYPLPMPKIPLLDLASARSGDKNDICNIGVLAKDAQAYALLKQYLKPELVKAHFKGLIKGEVIRYEWDSLEILNFVCHEALDGGASRSLRMDSLGKNFSSHLLRLELEIEE